MLDKVNYSIFSYHKLDLKKLLTVLTKSNKIFKFSQTLAI